MLNIWQLLPYIAIIWQYMLYVKSKPKKTFPVDFMAVSANNGYMERKPKESKEDFANFSIRLPMKLVHEIEAMAATENRTRNNMIEQMLWYAANRMHDTADPSMAVIK